VIEPGLPPPEVVGSVAIADIIASGDRMVADGGVIRLPLRSRLAVGGAESRVGSGGMARSESTIARTPPPRLVPTTTVTTVPTE
jgi:hypothetical protein